MAHSPEGRSGQRETRLGPRSLQAALTSLSGAPPPSRRCWHRRPPSLPTSLRSGPAPVRTRLWLLALRFHSTVCTSVPQGPSARPHLESLLPAPAPQTRPPSDFRPGSPAPSCGPALWPSLSGLPVLEAGVLLPAPFTDGFSKGLSTPAVPTPGPKAAWHWALAHWPRLLSLSPRPPKAAWDPPSSLPPTGLVGLCP